MFNPKTGTAAVESSRPTNVATNRERLARRPRRQADTTVTRSDATMTVLSESKRPDTSGDAIPLGGTTMPVVAVTQALDLSNGADFGYSQKFFHIADGTLYSVFSPLQGRSYGVKPSFLRKHGCVVRESRGRNRRNAQKALKFHNFIPSESITSERDDKSRDELWKVHAECRLREEHGTKQIMVSHWSLCSDNPSGTNPSPADTRESPGLDNSTFNADEALDRFFGAEDWRKRWVPSPDSSMEISLASNEKSIEPVLSANDLSTDNVAYGLNHNAFSSPMSDNVGFQSNVETNSPSTVKNHKNPSKVEEKPWSTLTSLLKNKYDSQEGCSFHISQPQQCDEISNTSGGCEISGSGEAFTELPSIRKHRRKPLQTRRVVPYNKYLSMLEDKDLLPLDLSQKSPEASSDIGYGGVPEQQLSAFKVELPQTHDDHWTKWEIGETPVEILSSLLAEPKLSTQNDCISALSPGSSVDFQAKVSPSCDPMSKTEPKHGPPLAVVYPYGIVAGNSSTTVNDKVQYLQSASSHISIPTSVHTGSGGILIYSPDVPPIITSEAHPTLSSSSRNTVANTLPAALPTTSTRNRLGTTELRYPRTHRKPSQRTIIRQKLEDAFRQNGFLVKTKQVSDGEATFCKFRQLRKYTRYYLKSWHHHLPEEVHKLWKGFLPPKTTLPQASSARGDEEPSTSTANTEPHLRPCL